jgi:hypothetical protein
LFFLFWLSPGYIETAYVSIKSREVADGKKVGTHASETSQGNEAPGQAKSQRI